MGAIELKDANAIKSELYNVSGNIFLEKLQDITEPRLLCKRNHIDDSINV